MARITFTDFNGKTMENVRKTLDKGSLIKPISYTAFDSAYANCPWLDSSASSTMIMACTASAAGTFKLVLITNDYNTYAIETSDFLKLEGVPQGEDLSLTGNLIVNGSTTLGDSSTDTILLKGTVNGADISASFSSVSATTGSFTNLYVTGSVSAATGSFTNLYVGGSVYQPFIASNTSSSADTSRFWINTNASVPTLYYYDVNSSDWVALGAVFG